MWPSGRHAGFVTRRSRVRLAQRTLLSHCLIPVSREFTHGCSRSTQPSYSSADRQKCSAATTNAFLRFTSPEPGNSQHKLVSGWGLQKWRHQPPTHCVLRSRMIIVVVVVEFLLLSLYIVCGNHFVFFSSESVPPIVRSWQLRALSWLHGSLFIIRLRFITFLKCFVKLSFSA